MKSNLYFIFAKDNTTEFLSIFKKKFTEKLYTIEPSENSVKNCLEFIKSIPDDSIIIYLGHGCSSGLYTPESKDFKRNVFIDSSNVNDLFKNKDIIFLSCRSSEFIDKVTTSKKIIGFGNILSSIEEVNIEAENSTGIYRNLSKQDIDLFNQNYCKAIIMSLEKIQNGIYCFKDCSMLIEYYINKNINKILLDKSVKNRVEIAKLLFEFRNEMIFKVNK